MGERESVEVHLSPVLRAALSSRQPGEDLDEALLRALKAEHPEHAVSLLSAVTGMIELEMKHAGEDRERVVQRLAAEEAGPRIALRTAGIGPVHVSFESAIHRVGDKEYRSLDELPPHLKRTIEARLERGKGVRVERGGGVTARTGCAMAPLLALWRLVWR